MRGEEIRIAGQRPFGHMRAKAVEVPSPLPFGRGEDQGEGLLRQMFIALTKSQRSSTLLIFFVSASMLLAGEKAVGPKISVPRDLPKPESSKVSSRNLIDQTH